MIIGLRRREVYIWVVVDEMLLEFCDINLLVRLLDLLYDPAGFAGSCATG